MKLPPSPAMKYLARHAEPESTAFPPPRDVRQVAVVPSMGEDDLLRPALASILEAGGPDVGVIVVLNARAGDAGSVHEANASARRWLDTLDPLRITVIDRAVSGRWLPDKQGVGLARKIGNDVALAWWAAGRVEHPMILQTDADARVPADWFARAATPPPGRGRCVARTFPFRHDAVAPVEDAAIEWYETWLRWHRLGLAWAGSPYAFQAIGSTLAIDAEALIVVRGIPRTMAGEDFYLLDKLAKVGLIHPAPGAPIRLAGRESDRVPFGTGRAMLDVTRRRATPADYRMPDPRSYHVLKVWLATMAAAVDPMAGWAGVSQELETRLEDAGLPVAKVIVAVDSMGALDFVTEAAHLNLTWSVRRRRLHTWFDAFRTLRLLHALRDALWPDLPWRDSIKRSPWLAEATGAAGGGLTAVQEVDERSIEPSGIDVGS